MVDLTYKLPSGLREPMPYSLTFSTQLYVPPSEAWKWITSFAGISKEMKPYLRMSTPDGVTNLATAEYVPGKRLFRSWIILFGLVPVDYSDLTLMYVEEGSGFVEQSPMGSMRLWRHGRRLTSNGAGCIITDGLTFEPRIAGWLSYRIVRAFFAHRHRNLAKYLGKTA